MVCVVAAQNEQQSSGCDLASVICISLNMAFLSSENVGVDQLQLQHVSVCH